MCMCVFVCTHVCVHNYTNAQIHVYIYTYTHIHKYMSTHTHLHSLLHIHVHMHIRMNICICIYIYICIYICTYMYIGIYIYTFTHIHVRIYTYIRINAYMYVFIDKNTHCNCVPPPWTMLPRPCQPLVWRVGSSLSTWQLPPGGEGTLHFAIFISGHKLHTCRKTFAETPESGAMLLSVLRNLVVVPHGDVFPGLLLPTLLRRAIVRVIDFMVAPMHLPSSSALFPAVLALWLC